MVCVKHDYKYYNIKVDCTFHQSTLSADPTLPESSNMLRDSLLALKLIVVASIVFGNAVAVLSFETFFESYDLKPTSISFTLTTTVTFSNLHVF